MKPFSTIERMIFPPRDNTSWAASLSAAPSYRFTLRHTRPIQRHFFRTRFRGLLSNALIFSTSCITPHIFQLVKLSCLPVKDVNDCGKIINKNPFASLLAFNQCRFNACFRLHLPDNMVCYASNLSIGITFTNDKKISRSVIQ